MKYFTFNNGVQIPALGLGTWKLTGDSLTGSLAAALEIGYRHIDTADKYGNQREIGNVLNTSGIKRSDIFLTSKVWHSNLHKRDVISSCERIISELKTSYVDLLLIHWPNSSIPLQETLESLNELSENKFIRAFGVSNFTVRHLEKALKLSSNIVCNQVEFHPSLNQKELKRYCDERGIVLTAYSPVAQGQDLKIPLILELSEKYGKSPSQIINNWLISKGIVTIPRSNERKHLEENFHSIDFELTKVDVERIEHIGGHNRIVKPIFSEFGEINSPIFNFINKLFG